MRTRSPVHLLVLSFAALGCGAPKPPPLPLPLPEGVTCQPVTKVSDAQALTQALAATAAGGCVVAYGGSYAGPFKVPAGVKFIALQGEKVQVSSESADVAAITLAGAEGTGLFQVHVVGGMANGIEVQGGPAQVNGVTVSATARAGILVSCPAGADCAQAASITDATLEDNGLGLWVVGAKAQVSGGAIRRSISRTLQMGHGVVVSSGGQLEATGMVIEACESAGLLIDGAGQRTTARLGNVSIRGNRSQGVVAQALSGTLADPWLVIENSVLEGNHTRGLLVAGSRGVRVSDTSVRATVETLVPTSIGSTEKVGDGVVVVRGSGDVRLERATVEGNPRCQVLIDDGHTGISIADSQVALDGGLYLVVVQASQPVDVPAAQVSTPATSIAP